MAGTHTQAQFSNLGELLKASSRTVTVAPGKATSLPPLRPGALRLVLSVSDPRAAPDTGCEGPSVSLGLSPSLSDCFFGPSLPFR